MAEAQRDEIAKLEALYAANPEGHVFTHLAEAYRKAGELEQARKVLTEGLGRHPESASAHVVLGRLEHDRGDGEAARVAFNRVLSLDAGNLIALRFLGDLALERGEAAEALGHFRELLTRDVADAALERRVAELTLAVEQGVAAPAAFPQEPAAAAESGEAAGIWRPETGPEAEFWSPEPLAEAEAAGVAAEAGLEIPAGEPGAPFDADAIAPGVPEAEIEAAAEPWRGEQPESLQVGFESQAEEPEFLSLDAGSAFLEAEEPEFLSLEADDVASPAEEVEFLSPEADDVAPPAEEVEFLSLEVDNVAPLAEEVEFLSLDADSAAFGTDAPELLSLDVEAGFLQADEPEYLSLEAEAEPLAELEYRNADEPVDVEAPGEYVVIEPPAETPAPEFPAAWLEAGSAEPEPFAAAAESPAAGQPEAAAAQPAAEPLTEAATPAEAEPTEAIPVPEPYAPAQAAEPEPVIVPEAEPAPSEAALAPELYAPAEAAEPEPTIISEAERVQPAGAPAPEAHAPEPAEPAAAAEPEAEPEGAPAEAGPEAAEPAVESVAEAGPEAAEPAVETVAEAGPEAAEPAVQAAAEADLVLAAAFEAPAETFPVLEELTPLGDLTLAAAPEPPAPEAAAGLFTETMAELYRRQGFPDRAAEVYRWLLAREPENARLQALLAEVEAEQALPLTGADETTPRAREWLQDLHSVESAFTGAAGVAGGGDSLYAWSGSGDEQATAGPAIRAYFAQLLAWRPAAAPTVPVEEAPGPVPELLLDEVVVTGPGYETAEGEPAVAPGPAEEQPTDLMPWEFAEPRALSATPGEEPGSPPPAGENEVPEYLGLTLPEAADALDGAAEEHPERAGEVEAEDEDLEMFRSWLQSLKK